VIILDLQNKTEKRPLSTRGRVFTGVVISNKMSKTATIEWEKRSYIPKYERYEKKRTRIHAHIPEGMIVSLGDTVKVMETRPISKTKTTLVIENLTTGLSFKKKDVKKSDVKEKVVEQKDKSKETLNKKEKGND
jgi:small subunit ribosomal protein S17